MKMETKNLVIKASLKKMFSGPVFYTSTIKDCIRLSKVIPEKDLMDAMQALNFVEFSQMDKELREWLFEETMDLFGKNDFDLSQLEILRSPYFRTIEVEKEAKKQNFIEKILSNF